MNLISKCNCCVCEPVCKYKNIYQDGIESIMNTIIKSDKNGGFWALKDCPHIQISIKCPHMITRSAVKEMTEG